MTVEIGYFAACPNCYDDMGVVRDPTTSYQEMTINNADMTAHVSEIPCDNCGTIVFRVKRMLRVAILI
jgi:hypothetical protein